MAVVSVDVSVDLPSRQRVRLSALPPLALYVHIPWCVKKCPYCDFNSHELRPVAPVRLRRGAGPSMAPPPPVNHLDAALESRYVDALISDLEQALPGIWGRRVHSIFFGGGTPSLLSGGAIDTLLGAFRARLPLAADCEITLEANPGTVEVRRFREFRAAGVNRLSLGIQSFNPQHLRALGRIHDGTEARRAIEAAASSFERINLDLMYGLPGQTPDEAGEDVRTALSFPVSHLSFYHLSIEPNTLFHRYPPALPDDDTSAQMQERMEARLAEAGYGHYETSAFARPGEECRHNLNYWRFGDYLGIGAGAHGKISFPDHIRREMRYKQPKEYLARTESGAPVQERQDIAPGQLGFEFMMNALRLTAGFPVVMLAERTGLSIRALERPLNEAERRGLIERTHEHVRPTLRGQRFLNDLLQLFLPEESPPD